MTALSVSSPLSPVARDRNAFLALTSLVWVGVLSGFSYDSYRHILKHGLDYPVIVHAHAVVFVGFLVLFTVQVVMIRIRRVDLHRRLGAMIAALAVAMVVLGPATAITVAAGEYARKGTTPEFLAVQLIDILAFATLSGAGLLLRRTPASHKRLMMLALIYISDAGFTRYLNGIPADAVGEGYWHDMVDLYLGSDLLMLCLGAFDLVTRGRLVPAYVVAAAWMILLQLTACAALDSPAWKALSLHLIGH